MSVTPIYGDDYNTRFNILIMRNELYVGNVPGAEGPKRVARIGDVVRDKSTGFYDVVDVSTGGIPTLEHWPVPNDEGLFNNTLIGRGNTSFRAYVDYSINPPLFGIDSLLEYAGSDHSYIKVFLGRLTEQNLETGEVISAYYNQSGSLVGENIPMELVLHEDSNNVARYAPKVGSLKRPIQANEEITVVAYSDADVVRSVNTLILVETSFIRRTEATQRQILNIELRAPFLSAVEPNAIDWPTNATMDSGQLIGRVTYTDRSVDYSVDKTKFRVLGMNGYVPGREGQDIPVTLSYLMADDEIANIVSGDIVFDEFEGRTLNRPYRLRTVQGRDAYSVTLFVAPRWIDAISGYRLEYWLYNKARNEARYVTPYVSQLASSAPFEPTLYGSRQTLTVELKLSDVSNAYEPWRHVQTFYVNLQRRGDIQQLPNWLIQYGESQSPSFGVDLVARMTYNNGSAWVVDLSCGQTDVEDWKQRTYFATKPIYDVNLELGPPEPTHFIVRIGSMEYEREISQWNSTFTTNASRQQGELIWLRFIRRTTDGDLELAMAGLPVYLM